MPRRSPSVEVPAQISVPGARYPDAAERNGRLRRDRQSDRTHTERIHFHSLHDLCKVPRPYISFLFRQTDYGSPLYTDRARNPAVSVSRHAADVRLDTAKSHSN